jgi:anti-anti-sigma regulatory factor
VSRARIQSCRLSPTTVQIDLYGPIEGDIVDSLRETLVDVLMRQRPSRVVVDASDATFLDPIALGSLAAASDTATDLGIVFDIIGAWPSAGA